MVWDIRLVSLGSAVPTVPYQLLLHSSPFLPEMIHLSFNFSATNSFCFAILKFFLFPKTEERRECTKWMENKKRSSHLKEK